MPTRPPIPTASVLAAYQDWMSAAPDDLAANVTVLQAGPSPTVMLSGTWQGGDPAGLTPYLDALVPAVGTAPLSRTVTDLSYRDAMAVADRHGNGESYQNTVDARLTDWRSAYYAENYPRLVRVKRCYDPTGFFRFPQAVGA